MRTHSFFGNRDLVISLCDHLDLTAFARQRLFALNKTFNGLWKTHGGWLVFAAETVQMMRVLDNATPDNLAKQAQRWRAGEAPFPACLSGGKYVQFVDPRMHLTRQQSRCCPRFLLMPRAHMWFHDTITDKMSVDARTNVRFLCQTFYANDRRITLARKIAITLLQYICAIEKGGVLFMILLANSGDLLADKKVQRLSVAQLPFDVCRNSHPSIARCAKLAKMTPKWVIYSVDAITLVCEDTTLQRSIVYLNTHEPPGESIFVHTQVTPDDLRWLDAYVHVATHGLVDLHHTRSSAQTLAACADGLRWYHTHVVTREAKLEA